ncbi:MAG: glycosyltransferase family 2 protein [Gemmatimonadota bacterium]|nr:glycosyltransferase family 2 protein [Gemmatimonadota bacterium]
MWLLEALFGTLLLVVGIVSVYALRHYSFTLNRLFGRQRHPYVDVQLGPWPTVDVLIPAHNEEAVLEHLLDALLASSYPPDRLRIVPVNDSSTDGTGKILDEYAWRFPGLVVPIHRAAGAGGKAAALKAATEITHGEVLIVFDADYTPGTDLLKQLVAPFFDPEVGAVMGRVVPLNVGRTLLTRLLDLERSGGYQVDQQARMNLRLVPQYGGTVGGVRRTALEEIGGWRVDTLTEDTDVTYRLVLSGWQVVYQNRSECYEEVPESWDVRIRQIRRWAAGHNEVMWRYGFPLLRTFSTGSAWQRLDGLLLLGVYAVAPLLVLGWVISLVLLYSGYPVPAGVLMVLAFTMYATLGNSAAFYEVAVAARLDGSRNRIRLLPLLIVGYVVSIVAVSRSLFHPSAFPRRGRAGVVWEKTARYRKSSR